MESQEEKAEYKTVCSFWLKLSILCTHVKKSGKDNENSSLPGFFFCSRGLNHKFGGARNKEKKLNAVSKVSRENGQM